MQKTESRDSVFLSLMSKLLWCAARPELNGALFPVLPWWKFFLILKVLWQYREKAGVERG